MQSCEKMTTSIFTSLTTGKGTSGEGWAKSLFAGFSLSIFDLAELIVNFVSENLVDQKWFWGIAWWRHCHEEDKQIRVTNCWQICMCCYVLLASSGWWQGKLFLPVLSLMGQCRFFFLQSESQSFLCKSNAFCCLSEGESSAMASVWRLAPIPFRFWEATRCDRRSKALQKLMAARSTKQPCFSSHFRIWSYIQTRYIDVPHFWSPPYCYLLISHNVLKGVIIPKFLFLFCFVYKY